MEAIWRGLYFDTPPPKGSLACSQRRKAQGDGISWNVRSPERLPSTYPSTPRLAPSRLGLRRNRRKRDRAGAAAGAVWPTLGADRGRQPAVLPLRSLERRDFEETASLYRGNPPKPGVSLVELLPLTTPSGSLLGSKHCAERRWPLLHCLK